LFYYTLVLAIVYGSKYSKTNEQLAEAQDTVDMLSRSIPEEMHQKIDEKLGIKRSYSRMSWMLI
jgi:hypothetical protein